jgi:hypothetical protein
MSLDLGILLGIILGEHSWKDHSGDQGSLPVEDSSLRSSSWENNV